MMELFEQLNKIPKETNTTGFRIDSYDGENLLITGSFDFCYYHEVEVEFQGVEYMDLPAHFDYPKFTLASASEQEVVRSKAALDNTISIYRVEAHTGCSMDNPRFYIAAAKVEVRDGMVFYYERENLKEGERIASWVSRSS